MTPKVTDLAPSSRASLSASRSAHDRSMITRPPPSTHTRSATWSAGPAWCSTRRAPFPPRPPQLGGPPAAVARRV